MHPQPMAECSSKLGFLKVLLVFSMSRKKDAGALYIY